MEKKEPFELLIEKITNASSLKPRNSAIQPNQTARLSSYKS
jgi:hypothetical protein